MKTSTESAQNGNNSLNSRRQVIRLSMMIFRVEAIVTEIKESETDRAPGHFAPVAEGNLINRVLAAKLLQKRGY